MPALPHRVPFSRIVRDPHILGGEPTIQGTRISVRSIVIEHELSGSVAAVHKAYPALDLAAIREALDF